MCWKCGTVLDENEPVSRSAECPVCHADVHSCRNCLYYEPGSHYDCHETVDSLVSDKERSNFCEHFKLNRSASSSDSAQKQAAAKKAFDSLFTI